MIIKKDLIEWIKILEKNNQLYKFYKSKYWISLSKEVLKEQHYECQICLKKGILKPANTVHHVNYVKERPDLALSKEFINIEGKKEKNLLAICFECHNMIHKRFGYKESFNEERW